jgi:hypothetical protein
MLDPPTLTRLTLHSYSNTKGEHLTVIFDHLHPDVKVMDKVDNMGPEK